MKINQKTIPNLGCLFVVLFFTACQTEKKSETIIVKVENTLDFSRNEVVAIRTQDLSNFFKNDASGNIRIKREGAENYLRTQWIDYNQDGEQDELLFQAEVYANGSASFLVVLDSASTTPKSDVMAYSRLVPERSDDYTWENDKVAFRTYGPTGEKEALAGVPGSTLSSGIDLWLKRTDKSIINEWYKAHLTDPGYYHIDHGEGYDPYHVGKSRGTGGIGIWQNDSLIVSNNFTVSRTLAAGPLRTVFELDYAPWSEYGVQETKRITLDLGSNFSKFEISLDANQELPNYTVGLTLHENKGVAKINKDEGWFRHWETIDSSKVGEGIVIDPKVVDSVIINNSTIADKSSILVLTKPEQKLNYYAGFAWDKSGQIRTVEDWETLLKQQSQILDSPLKVSINVFKK